MKDRSTVLLETIRRWIAASKFSREKIDSDEIVNEAYCRLTAMEPLPEDGEKFSFTVEQVVRHTIRDLKRNVTVAADIDELPLDEHPFYESDVFSSEKQFEEVFGLFCESQLPAPMNDATLEKRDRTDDRRRIEANVKETQILATISQLQTQIAEWFEIAPDDMHEGFDKRLRKRIGDLID